MAAAAASFRISTDSMSLGFRALRLPLGSPSITNSGSVLFTVPTPLISTWGLRPGDPLLVTVTPAARPCKAASTLATGSRTKSSALTEEMAPVTSRRSMVP